MKFISIDMETTGLDADRDQIIEFAAVLFDPFDRKVETKEFSTLVCHERYSGSAFALGMNAEIMKGLGNGHGTDIEELSEVFVAWLIRNKVGGDFTPVGKNFGTFDRNFLLRIPDPFKISHRCLDVGSLYMRKGDKEVPNTKVCLERAGMSVNLTHRALGDAKMVCELIWRYYEGKA